jgi:UDP-sugar pyrophosphorylase
MDATADASLRAALLHWHQHHVLAQLEVEPALLQQLRHFESWYPGGIDSYLRTATRLWHESSPANLPGSHQQDSEEEKESDPFAPWVPTIPHDEYGLLSLDASKFRELETLGLGHAAQSVFVVVAGGLGERLGYNGIKLALPVETATRMSYLQLYIEHIQALEHATNSMSRIPLAIMTSDATHVATQQFLLDHEYFGMPPTQITLLKQDTVPCVDAIRVGDETVLHLVLDAKANTLVMKPHGHGDVHTLLHTSGLAHKWLRDHDKKYVHFIQDTNALILQSTLPLLAASVLHKWKWAFTVVPRKAKDASGAIVQFTHPQDANHTALFNVEYHELDQFLRTQAGDAFKDGDTNDPSSGFSPFPGNINHFVAELEAYVHVLDASRGKTPEIFNPKYRTDAPGLFKSPARLECMMQDFPKLLVSHQAEGRGGVSASTIGFLSFPASLVYSPCKNDTASAAAKVQSDIPPQCACSAEHDWFAHTKAKLQQVGVAFEGADQILGARSDWLGIPVPPNARGPLVVLTSSFAVGLDALAQRFPAPAQIKITTRSTLIVEGAGARGVTFLSLRLDGALRITACEGAVVDVRGLDVENAGFEYTAVDTSNGLPVAVDAMRGYVLRAREVMELTFREPGRYVVEKTGKITKE